MVIIRRNLYGNELVLSNELVEMVEEKMDIENIKKVERLFFNIFSKKVSLNEMVFLYLIRWDTLILNEMNTIIPIEIVNEETKKMVNNCILKQIKILKINRNAHPQVYPYFKLFFTHILTMSIISPLFQKCNDETRIFVQTTHASLYHFWLKELLENELIFKDISHVYFEDLAAQLTMLTLPYLKKDFAKTKHVVFILETDVINLNYVTKLAERYILNNVQVSVISHIAFSKKLAETLHADLLVSNFELETNEKIVYISDLPTVREWNYINDLIFNLDEFDTDSNLKIDKT